MSAYEGRNLSIDRNRAVIDAVWTITLHPGKRGGYGGGERHRLRGGDRQPPEEERPGMALKRRGEADEVASVISFLCSERASFVNGRNYRVHSGSVLAV